MKQTFIVIVSVLGISTVLIGPYFLTAQVNKIIEAKCIGEGGTVIQKLGSPSMCILK